MFAFLLWCILFVLCWPLALLALVAYPFIWLLLLPFRILGVAVHGVLEIIFLAITLPFRLLAAPFRATVDGGGAWVGQLPGNAADALVPEGRDGRRSTGTGGSDGALGRCEPKPLHEGIVGAAGKRGQRLGAKTRRDVKWNKLEQVVFLGGCK